MRTMKIEKELLFPNQVKENVELHVQSDLTYHKEIEGVRALGELHIQGAYRDEYHNIQEYRETLDMDILAPNHKLSEENFQLDIQNYQAHVKSDGILLDIEIGIYGLLEKEIEYVEEIRNTHQAEVVKEQEAEEHEIEEETQFEDLFEDDEATFTSYRMVVAKESDTYSAIAHRYDVKEDELRTINNHKEVIAKSLLILP